VFYEKLLRAIAYKVCSQEEWKLLDSEKMVDLLFELVAIDSVNPSLVPGAKGEGEIANFVANWLRAQGVEEVYLDDKMAPGRPNVLAIVRGSGGGRSLLLNAHLDTVGMAGMESSNTPFIRDGRLYGRGSLDTKGGLAAFMAVVAELNKKKLRGDLILAAVVDEEYASLGTETLISEYRTDAAIVAEPTNLMIITAHKGFVWLELETYGVAAHGSKPEIGVDAITKMGKVLVALEDLERDLLKAKKVHPLLGTGSIHASLIQGGQELSSYPSSCRLSIERRTIPGERVDDVEKEILSILDAIRVHDPAFKFSLNTLFAREPMHISPTTPIAQIVKKHAENRLGDFDLQVTGSSIWMDSSLLSAAGIPTIVFGPCGEGLHGKVEWVDLESVRCCSDIVLKAAEEFCT
jgi:acetylornithine deacetylase